MREVDEELRKTKEQLRAERWKWEEEREGFKQVCVLCVTVCEGREGYREHDMCRRERYRLWHTSLPFLLQLVHVSECSNKD